MSRIVRIAARVRHSHRAAKYLHSTEFFTHIAVCGGAFVEGHGFYGNAYGALGVLMIVSKLFGEEA